MQGRPLQRNWKTGRIAAGVFFAAVVATGLMLHGCDGGSKRHVEVKGSDVLADVDGFNITVDYFKTALNGNVPQDVKVRRKALDELVRDTLLYKYAVHKGFNETSQIKGDMILYFSSVMPEVLRSDIAKSIVVTDDEIPEEEIADTPIITLSQIVVPTLDKAEEAKALLDKGEDFGKVAREHSKGISAQGGGRIGQIDLMSSIYSPGVKAVINKLKVGEISPITKTDMGYSIFRVDDRVEPDEVRRQAVERLREEIKKKKVDEAVAELIKDMRSKSVIRYNEKLIAGDLSQKWGVEVDGIKVGLAKGLLDKEEITSHTPHGGFKPANVKKEMDDLVDRILMYKESVNRGLDTDPAIDMAARIKLSQVVSDLYVQDQLGPFDPTPEEIQAYYDKYKDRFARKTIVRLGRVLTDNEADAEKALAELKSGEKLMHVAAKWSIDKSRETGGDTGWSALDDLVEPVKDAVAKLNVGDITPVLKTQYGYEVFKVLAREEGGIPEMSEIMGKLTKKVELQKRSDAVEALFKKVYSGAKVKVNEDLLRAL